MKVRRIVDSNRIGAYVKSSVRTTARVQLPDAADFDAAAHNARRCDPGCRHATSAGSKRKLTAARRRAPAAPRDRPSHRRSPTAVVAHPTAPAAGSRAPAPPVPCCSRVTMPLAVGQEALGDLEQPHARLLPPQILARRPQQSRPERARASPPGRRNGIGELDHRHLTEQGALQRRIDESVGDGLLIAARGQGAQYQPLIDLGRGQRPRRRRQRRIALGQTSKPPIRATSSIRSASMRDVETPRGRLRPARSSRHLRRLSAATRMPSARRRCSTARAPPLPQQTRHASLAQLHRAAARQRLRLIEPR